GGNIHNRVPEEARMTLNIRYTETTEPDTLIENLKQISGLDIDVRMQSQPVFCDEQNPEIQRLKKSMREFFARKIYLKRSNGATDARHFVDSAVPIAIIGVPGQDQHGGNEAVSISGLRQYKEMLHKFNQSFSVEKTNL
ncbi:MAG: M20/M25/M40 family metallo-hydrolase, partial [Verrucomicrobiota bacterium]